MRRTDRGDGRRSHPLTRSPYVRIQTVAYRYNARRPGSGVILRYESPHSETHRPNHHGHRYDVLNGDPEGTIADCEWPVLRRVIEELRDWYCANFGMIADQGEDD